MMQQLFLADANSSVDCLQHLVTALERARPYTPLMLERLMRVFELLLDVAAARSSLVFLLQSTVWSEACSVLLPLTEIKWCRALVALGLHELSPAEQQSCRWPSDCMRACFSFCIE
jgi:hypothetical protein